MLGAVKRAVDGDFRGRRFILTGSVRAELAGPTWPGTGRVSELNMYPLTVAERQSRVSAPLVDRVVSGRALRPAEGSHDLRDYIRLAMQSGFPEALALSERAHQEWLGGYVGRVITRDAAHGTDRSRDPTRLRRYFEAVALHSAEVVDHRTIYGAVGISHATAENYERLLANLRLVDATPAWTTNRLKRLRVSPKRYLIDAALLTGLLQADARTVLRDGTMLSRVLDTFVASELRAQLEFSATRGRLHHLRQNDGRHEVDLVIEVDMQRLIGIEVKATAAPTAHDARHLAWLRDQLRELFVAGVVLHTGPQTFSLGDRIVAAPISTLWA